MRPFSKLSELRHHPVGLRSETVAALEEGHRRRAGGRGFRRDARASQEEENQVGDPAAGFSLVPDGRRARPRRQPGGAAQAQAAAYGEEEGVGR